VSGCWPRESGPAQRPGGCTHKPRVTSTTTDFAMLTLARESAASAIQQRSTAAESLFCDPQVLPALLTRAHRPLVTSLLVVRDEALRFSGRDRAPLNAATTALMGVAASRLPDLAAETVQGVSRYLGDVERIMPTSSCLCVPVGKGRCGHRRRRILGTDWSRTPTSWMAPMSPGSRPDSLWPAREVPELVRPRLTSRGRPPLC